MRRFFWTFAAGSACFVVGCSSSSGPSRKQASHPAEPSQGQNPTTAPGQKPKNPVIEKLNSEVQANLGGQVVPSAPKTDNWNATKLTPEALAEKGDAALNTLRLSRGEYTYEAPLPAGKAFSRGVWLIRDGKTFAAEYGALAPTLDSITKMKLVVNHGKAATLPLARGEAKVEPVEALIAEQNEPLADWIIDFQRIVLGGVAGGTPFQHMLQKAKQLGFTALAEERSVPYGRDLALQARMLLSKPDAEAKKSGPATFEATFDRSSGIPVTIRINSVPTGKKPIRIMWTIAWMKTNNPALLKDSEFEIPKIPAPAKTNKT